MSAISRALGVKAGTVYSWLKSPPGGGGVPELVAAGAARGVVGKGSEVNRNEGLHSWLQGKLNRPVRKTKGYSKRARALGESLALVWIWHNLI